MPSHKLK